MNAFHQTYMAMGTRLDILLPGIDQERGERVSFILQREVGRLEQVYSRYLPDSETIRINQEAAFKPVVASAEFFSILLQCVKWNDLTDGYFDISRGKLSVLYKNNPHPEHGEMNNLHQHSGMQFIELNKSDNTVNFLDKDVSLDFGAIGKGIALEQFRRILQREGVPNALINFGDSSVLAHGNHPYGDTWAVGIRKPDELSAMEQVVYLKDQTLSSSGVNAKNSLSENEITGHILDPHTGLSVNKIGAVSVVSSDPVEAEVLSTALFCAPVKMHEKILSNFKPARAIYAGYQPE